MGSRHDEKRLNVEGDRLSSLPDDLIHKILSSISLKQAIETSTLSSRWRYIWTSMPYLDFSTESFSKWKMFSKFVTKILSRRNNQVQLSSVKLRVHGKATQALVKRILNYAFSHNVEQLTFVSFDYRNHIASPINLFSSQSLKHLTLTLCSGYKYCTLSSTWDLPALTTLSLSGIKLDDNFFSNCPNLKNLTLYSCHTTIRLSEESGDSLLQLTFVSSANKDDIPINLFSSQSLKRLTLTLSSYYVSCTLTSTWDLPALTTLCLTSVKLDDDFFSNCPNLKNLTLYSCDTTIRLSEESEDSHLNICLPKLSNLTIINISCNVVNVEAPQLKNLIMREDYYYNVNFSADALLSLEKVDLTIRYPHKAQTIFCLLQQFHSVEFLTLNLEIVEVCCYWLFYDMH
ncbi:F-box domain containing protein [Tanacetum coccineum]